MFSFFEMVSVYLLALEHAVDRSAFCTALHCTWSSELPGAEPGAFREPLGAFGCWTPVSKQLAKVLFSMLP